MKKLLLVICALLCANMLFAQENVKKEKDLAVVVDSLTTKLNKLQKDYDYLYCKILLNDGIINLNDVKNDISNSSNMLLFVINQGRFDYGAYNTHKELYNAAIKKLDVTKVEAESVKNFVTLKMITSNFSENELSALQHRLNFLDYSIFSVEAYLKLYDLYIKEYRNK
jgi:hypothetical protein